MSGGRSVGAAGFVGALVTVLGLGLQIAAAHTDGLEKQSAYRRLWTDLALAIDSYLDASEPMPVNPDAPEATRAYGDVLVERARLNEIEPHEFWRTLRNKPFNQYRGPVDSVPFDDTGRARLLGWGFRALGGISPFLILWIGWFVAAPVIFWLWFEFSRAGWAPAATVLSTLLVITPFFAETLSLTRYAVAFYLIAVLLAITVIVPAVAPAPPTFRGSLCRAAMSGLLLALCISCRSSVSFTIPGLLAAFGLAAHRLPRPARIRWLAAAALALTFLTPAFVTRPEAHHDIWPPIWEGLGDFDRTHDHVWNDKDATEFARARGLEEGKDFRLPEAEPIFRQAVLDHVTSNPAWYAGILVKRFASTVTLWKLWPFTVFDDEFIRRSTSPNEGVIDKYFTYTTTVEFVGGGDWTWETPVQLILLPTVALIGLMVRRDARARVAPFAKAIFCLALVVLPLPVLMTTAGGQETQTFALVHMLSAAFLLQALVDRRRRGSSP